MKIGKTFDPSSQYIPKIVWFIFVPICYGLGFETLPDYKIEKKSNGPPVSRARLDALSDPRTRINEALSLLVNYRCL